MATALVECFLASHAAPPQERVLDFDATDDPVHGRQDNRFFHGYYDGYCFLPLYVTGGDHLLVAYLRPSNIDACRHSRAILKLLVQRLRRAWPDVRIVVRADSGFGRWRLFKIGAWVQRSVRRVVVRMASSCPWPELFAGAVGRLVRPGAGAASGP